MTGGSHGSQAVGAAALPGVWRVLFSRAQFITLPLACMSQDMQQFIAQRIETRGGKNVC
ncbi:hypothetical protein J2W68_003309 [Luteimonas terrae]|uniref:Uncharacterized protein n=1 Tax=Luteimonas terrae TaxID=1530191 RepID=A0ABU1Y2J9_9GAMM|nr:hypothetical protein [Luteimonas terrae]